MCSREVPWAVRKERAPPEEVTLGGGRVKPAFEADDCVDLLALQVAASETSGVAVSCTAAPRRQRPAGGAHTSGEHLPRANASRKAQQRVA